MSVKVNGIHLGLRLLWSNQACTGSKLLTRRALPQTSVSVRHHNFDGEAYSKTNMSLLTDEDESHTYIGAYSRYGFKLTSGFRVLGPCAVFPRAVLGWNVASADKITPESLSLFTVLEPKPDILVIGKGDFDAEVNKDIIKYLRSKKINVEILPTEQACSTFNFLNSERRVVAAALIPPTRMEQSEDFYIGDGPPVEVEEESMETETGQKISKTVEQLSAKNMMDALFDSDRGRKRSSPEFRDQDQAYDVDKDKDKKS